ncbi:radical SAM protein [Candidatus Omnitrophota bacterium]
MRVLLLQYNSPKRNYATPLGLAYIGTVLKNDGAEVKIVDATAPYARYSRQDLVGLAKRFNPEFIGMTLSTLFVGFAYDLIKDLKRLKIPIVAGGVHATIFAHEVLARGVDIAVRGEGEQTALELADYFKKRKQLKDILGISYWQRGAIIDNPPRGAIEQLDRLPFPERKLFNISDYLHDDSDLWRFGNIISSRGCVGKCSFCSREVFGKKYIFRSADNIIQEMKSLHQEYGITNFSFLDSVFTANRNRTLEFCRKVKHELNFTAKWVCITRIDCISPDLLPLMAAAGCRMINYGVESANPNTLTKLNKGVTIEEIKQRISQTRAAGIDCSINFMWGYPWETEQQLDNTISLMHELSEEVAEIMPGGMLIPFPGTQIYEEYKDAFGLQQWWLSRDKFTGGYRVKQFAPLFRIFFFDDQGQLEGPGFFNLSSEMKVKISSAANFIGRHNLEYHNPLFGRVILAACLLSRALYRLNPGLERLFTNLALLLIDLRHSACRSRKRLRAALSKNQELAEQIDKRHQQLYSQEAKKYDQNRFSSSAGSVFFELEEQLIKRMLGPETKDKIVALDVASGTGRIAGAIARRRNIAVTAVDQNIDMLHQAEQKARQARINNIGFAVTNARQLAFKEQSFDLVSSIRFLTIIKPEHFSFYIDEMKRVLKTGGVLLVEFNNKLDLRELIRIVGRRKSPWPWQINRIFSGMEIVDKKGCWFPGHRRLVNYNTGWALKLAKLGAYFPFYHLTSQVIVKAVKR